MFGIGLPEMLIVLAVALIFIGPKKLPDLAKSLGRAMGEFKRATSDLKQSIESETGVDDVRQSFDEVKEDIKAQVDLAGEVPDPSPSPSESPTDLSQAASLDPAKENSAEEGSAQKDSAQKDSDDTSDGTKASADGQQDDSSPDDDSDSRDTHAS
jgi:sec-independent protein translocase protein TatB